MGKRRGPKPSDGSTSSALPSAAAAVAGFAAAGSIAYAFLAPPSGPPPFQPVPSVPVPIVTWRDGDTLADFPRVALAAFEAHRSPVLLRGVPLSSWGGRALWSPPREHLEALIASASPTARPKVSRSSFFQYFFSPKQNEWRDRWGLEPPPTNFHWDHDANADVLRQLLEGRRDEGERYGYWILRMDEVPDVAGALSAARPSVRAAFGSPDLQAKRRGPVSEAPLTHMDSLFWMTSPGVANNMHFDVDWNYLIHAAGPKRVLLAPPSDAHRMQLYPRAHPSLRSSPIDLRLDWPSLVAERPLLRNVTFLEADLQPLDVLLIPPFWLHFIEVGTQGPATSYSFFSACAEGEFLSARVRPPRTPAEALMRMLAAFDGYFEDELAANHLTAWGAQWRPHRKPQEEQEEDMLDLGPTANRAEPVATANGGAALHFLSQDILSLSLRSNPQMASMFCSHAPDLDARRGSDARSRGSACPDPVAHLRRMGKADAAEVLTLVSAEGQWAARLRDVVTDRAIAGIIMQAEVEDLAYHAWGPLQACAMIERCVAPLLGETPL